MTNHHQMLRLRMCGAMSPLSHLCSA